MKNAPYSGLSAEEVVSLQAKYGKNDVSEKIISPVRKFLGKFISPITLMIETALILSLLLGRFEDFFIILLLLAVNVGVDFFQEQKASRALAVLSQALAPTAKVVRSGSLTQIDATLLVPGDVVKLSIGDIVPADCIVLDKTYIEVDQSAITGESFSISATKGESLCSGAVIIKGAVYATVTHIGINTSLGKSVELVAKAEQEKESHFQIAIVKIGKFLIIFSLVLIVLTGIVLFVRGNPILETIRFALVLTIASIPVALPAVLSVTMAIGANTLARRHTIVSNFKAIEELAGVDQLCIDKTGTLTLNAIAVANPVVFGDYSIEKLFEYSLLALEGDESSIQKAITIFAEQHQFSIDDSIFTTVSRIPFDPVLKVSSVVCIENEETITLVLGAPQMIASQLTDESEVKELTTAVDKLATAGYRTVALLKGSKDSVQLCGLIPLLDPLRESSPAVLADIASRGINVKMLTGDNTAIARTIAAKLSISESFLSSAQLKVLRETDHLKYLDTITNTNVFTEVVPEDKYAIVEVLQTQGHIVAMTGDGVNDAPALKKADIGIAVSGATPAARSAADVVLLDDGLEVIIEAITIARATFARMQSYAIFRISETIRIVCFIVASIIAFNYTPITAVMIIMLALLNDVPVMAIAYDNVAISDVPVRWNLNETLIIASALGFTGLVSSFGLLYYLYTTGVSLAIIQSIIFLKLDVAGHSTLYVTRTGRRHFWQKPWPALKFFLPAFSSRLVGTAIVYFGIFMAPLSLSTITIVWLYATGWFFFNDFVKVRLYELLDNRKQKKAQLVSA